MHFIFCCFYKKISAISLRNPPHGTLFMRWISIAYYYQAVGDIKFSNVYFLSPEAYILIFGIKWKKNFFSKKNFVYPPIRICMTDQIHMGGYTKKSSKKIFFFTKICFSGLEKAYVQLLVLNFFLVLIYKNRFLAILRNLAYFFRSSNS